LHREREEEDDDEDEDEDEDEDDVAYLSGEQTAFRTITTNQNTQANSFGTSAAVSQSFSSVMPAPDIIIHEENIPSSEVDPSDQWHVFSLMATSVGQNVTADQPLPDSRTLELDHKTLRDDIDEIERYLSSVNRRPGESDAYEQCPANTIQDIKGYLNSLVDIPSNDTNNVNGNRRHLVRAASSILSFFFPPRYDHAVTGKYWGAIYRMLTDGNALRSPSRFGHTVRMVHRLAGVVEDLKEELFSKHNPAHNQTNVPHEFVQAWMLCNMYFVLYTTDQADRSRKYLRRCRALLTQGKMKAIQRLQTASLRNREEVSPLGVATLFVGQLLHDVGGGPLFHDRHHLASKYWDYLQQLVRQYSAMKHKLEFRLT
jgi:hypothetical protein